MVLSQAAERLGLLSKKRAQRRSRWRSVWKRRKAERHAAEGRSGRRSRWRRAWHDIRHSAAQDRTPPLLFDPLEPRLLLNSDLVLDLTSLTNPNQDQSLLVRLVNETPSGESSAVDRIKILDANNGNAQLAVGTLSDVDHVSITTGGGSDTVTFDATSFASLLTDTSQVPTFSVDTGVGGSDRLVITNVEDTHWYVTAAGSGLARSSLNASPDALAVAFSGVEALTGGSGADRLRVHTPAFSSVAFSGTPASGSATLGSARLSYLGFEQTETALVVDLTSPSEATQDQSLLVELVEETETVGNTSTTVHTLRVVDENDADAVLHKHGLSGITNVSLLTGTGDDSIHIDGNSFASVLDTAQMTQTPSFSVFAGGGDEDRLIIANAENTGWDLSTSNAGTASGTLNGTDDALAVTFAGVESLAGGAGTDRLRVLRPGFENVSFSGTPEAGSATLGSATLAYVDFETIDAVLLVDLRSSSTARNVRAQVFAVTRTVDNETTTVNRLKILDVDDANAVLAEETVTDITSVIIQTGSGNDTVTIDAGSFGSVLTLDTTTNPLPRFRVDAGAGQNRLAVAATEDTQWRVSKTVGSGSVAAEVDHIAAALSIDYTGFASLQGATGAGTDTLVGANKTNRWSLTGTGAGSLKTSSPVEHVFSGFERVVGGTGADTVVGRSVDTNWQLTSAGAVQVDGLTFSGLETLSAGSGTNTLLGPSARTVWLLNATDAGTVRVFGSAAAAAGAGALAFSGIDNLTGAAGADDQFGFATGAGLSGTIQGGTGGTDILLVDETLFPNATYSNRTGAAGSVSLNGNTIAYAGLERPSLTVGGTAADKTLSGTSHNDDLTLGLASQAGKMRLSSRNSYMDDVVFAIPTNSLTLNLGGGDDTLTITRFGHGYGASLTVNGGESLFLGDTIIVASGVLVSTRALSNPGVVRSNPSSAHTTEHSIDDSGQVKLYAEKIDIKAGARILTHVVGGSLKTDGTTVPDAGDIELIAAGDRATGTGTLIPFGKTSVEIRSKAVLNASGASGGSAGAVTIKATNQPVAIPIPIVDIFLPEAYIHIADATISGGDITIVSKASAKSPLTADGFAKGIVSNLTGIMQEIPGMVLSSLTGVNLTFSLRQTKATVTLSGTQLTASGDVTVTSDSAASASAKAVSISRGLSKLNSKFRVAFAFARASATAETTLDGTTHITAAGDISLESSGENKAKPSARTSNILEIQAARLSPDKFQSDTYSIAIAIGNTGLTSRTTLGRNTVVRSTGGNVDILADGVSESKPKAKVKTYVAGRLGFTVALNVALSKVEASVDGTVSAAGTTRVADHTFDPQTTGTVDVLQNTVRLPDHGLSTGDQFVYTAGSGSPIGGLQDGQTYTVLVVDANTVQFTKLAPADLDTTGVDATATHALAEPAFTDFALNAIDASGDRIRLPGHDFASGDTVTYTNSGNGNIGGLSPDTSYQVVRVDDEFIQLKAAGAGSDDPAIQVSQGPALGWHDFRPSGDEPAYRLTLGRLDVTTNTFHVANHGLAKALDKKGVYRQLGNADGLAGLDPSVEYDIVVVDNHAFQLEDPATGQVVDLVAEEDGAITRNTHTITYFDKTVTNFNPVNDVNSSRDTITIADHGFQTGDQVVYGTDPTKLTTENMPIYHAETPALQETLQVQVADTELGGLEAGNAYRVVRVDRNTIRLIDAEQPQAESLPIDLTSTGQGSGHALYDASTGGMREEGLTIAATLKAKDYVASKPGLSSKFNPTDLLKGLTGGSGESGMVGLFGLFQLSKGVNFLGGKNMVKDQKALESKANSGGAGKVSLSAGLAINVTKHQVLTQVGQASGATPDLDSGAELSITSTLKESQQVFARGSARKPGGSKGGAAVSVTIGFGAYINSAQAIVGSSASLDAAGTLTVASSLEYPFLFDEILEDPLKLVRDKGIKVLSAVFDPFSFIGGYVINTWVDTRAKTEKKKDEKAARSVAVTFGASVFVNTSEAIIKSGARLNQNPVFTALPTQSVEVRATTKMTQISVAGTGKWKLLDTPLSKGLYEGKSFKDIVRGADLLPMNRSGGSSVGATVLIDVTLNTTTARIERDAVITIGSAGRLSVAAKEQVLRVAVAGGANLAAADGQQQKPSVAFTGSVTLIAHVSNTKAGIEANAQKGATVNGGGDVAINALSKLTNVSVAGTLSWSEGSAPGIGISAVVNAIRRNTDAYIGRPGLSDATLAGSSAFNVGGLTVSARTEGGSYAFAVTGSVSNAKQDTSSQESSDSDFSSGLDGVSLPGLFGEASSGATGPATKLTNGIGVAGGAAVNASDENTRAGINAAGTFTADTFDIAAVRTTNLVAASGGVALSYNSGSSSKSSTSLSGAFSINVGLGTTEAFIKGATIASTASDRADRDEIAVRALREGFALSFSIAVAANTSKRANAFSGSVSVSRNEDDTRAVLERVAVTAKGDVRVRAKNVFQLFTLGGGVSFSGRTGVGFSIGYNQIANTTSARVVGADTANRASLSLGGGLALEALNDNTIRAIAVSAGVQAGASQGQGVAGAFTMAINIISVEPAIFTGNVDASEHAVEALIRHANVTAHDDVSLTARDNSVIQSLAGALGVGTKAAAFGVGLGWNQVNNNVRAIIDQATVSVQSGGDLSLLAEATENDTLTNWKLANGKISAAALGGAVGKKTSIGVTLAINGITALVKAEIGGGSTISVAGDVTVAANDSSTIRTLTGGVAISAGSAAVGAGIAANFIANTVHAQITDATVSSGGDILVRATEKAAIQALTIGAGIAKGVSLAGSVSVQVLTNTTTAAIDGSSTVTAADNVRVLADNTAKAHAGTGQLSIGGRAAVGASVNTLTIVNRTQAYIGSDAQVSTTRTDGGMFTDITGAAIAGVSVEARSQQSVWELAVGGSVSKGLAAGVSGTVVVVDDRIRAWIAATGTAPARGVDSKRDVNVVASSELFLVGLAGALGAGKAGVGIGIDLGVITRVTEASIAAKASVKAGDSVFVQALGSERIVSVSAAVAVGAKIAVGVTAGVGMLTSRVEASIGSSASVFADGHVLVSADGDTDTVHVSGNVSAGGKAAVGVAVGIGILNKTTTAYIDTQARVTGLGHDAALSVNAARSSPRSALRPAVSTTLRTRLRSPTTACRPATRCCTRPTPRCRG